MRPTKTIPIHELKAMMEAVQTGGCVSWGAADSDILLGADGPKMTGNTHLYGHSGLARASSGRDDACENDTSGSNDDFSGDWNDTSGGGSWGWASIARRASHEWFAEIPPLMLLIDLVQQTTMEPNDTPRKSRSASRGRARHGTFGVPSASRISGKAGRPAASGRAGRWGESGGRESRGGEKGAVFWMGRSCWPYPQALAHMGEAHTHMSEQHAHEFALANEEYLAEGMFGAGVGAGSKHAGHSGPVNPSAILRAGEHSLPHSSRELGLAKHSGSPCAMARPQFPGPRAKLPSAGMQFPGGCDLLERSVFVDLPADRAVRVWAIDLVLRSPATHAVIADGRGLSMAQSRRVQLAAEAGNALALLWRTPIERSILSVAHHRWLVTPMPTMGIHPRWEVERLRCKDAAAWRQGVPRKNMNLVVVEHRGAQGVVTVSANVADRSHTPATRPTPFIIPRRRTG